MSASRPSSRSAAPQRSPTAHQHVEVRARCAGSRPRDPTSVPRCRSAVTTRRRCGRAWRPRSPRRNGRPSRTPRSRPRGPGVADHVAVGEVHHDERFAVGGGESLEHGVAHPVGAHLRLLVVGRDVRRARHDHPGLAFERLLAVVVEEEGDVGELLRLAQRNWVSPALATASPRMSSMRGGRRSPRSGVPPRSGSCR